MTEEATESRPGGSVGLRLRSWGERACNLHLHDLIEEYILAPKAARTHLLDEANPRRALELMAAAFSLLSKNKEKTANLPLRQVVEIRAKSLSETGQSPRAKKGLSALRAALHYRGVKNTVLKAIQTFE